MIQVASPSRGRVVQDIRSHNFGFMRGYEPQFDRLGALAERYFRDDPNTCLIKLRQFGELLAQEVAARTGMFASPEEPQANLLRRPSRRDRLGRGHRRWRSRPGQPPRGWRGACASRSPA
ncbi:MAG TPA: hypothetical protein VFY87_31590, partial [Geminicoccaceae bacterium]|nr:hypothetical protein [Geminicoccaceae bacterium]